MIYETIVIAGLILILIAIAGNQKIEIKEVKIGYLTNAQRSIIGVLGIIVLIVGIGIWDLVPGPDLVPDPDNGNNVTIEITNPIEGAEVSSPLLVEGTFDGELSEDWYLWMFVYDYEEWWPVNRIEPFEGEWDSKVWLNVGKRDIVVVLGDKDADSEFQQMRSENSSLGILPQGVKIYYGVTVNV